MYNAAYIHTSTYIYILYQWTTPESGDEYVAVHSYTYIHTIASYTELMSLFAAETSLPTDYICTCWALHACIILYPFCIYIYIATHILATT